MRSFTDLDRTFVGQPPRLGAVLARIDTGRGREALFQEQVPQVLRQLTESARIASITASNAIEGVVVDHERAIEIVEGARFRNRNEQEFAGYRDAIDGLMRLVSHEPLSIPLLLHLHRQLFLHAGGRGGYLKTDPNLIVSYQSGEREIVFEPVPPEDTEFFLGETFVRYSAAQRERLAHPIVLIGALILDVLAIHPVADGNGRLARLLTTYELLRHGYGVARYISLEQRIYESKSTYYARLFESQRKWHAGEHTIWPWVSYLASVLELAYQDFEALVAEADRSDGNKQDRVRRYVLDQGPARFARRDVKRALPDVSEATIRLVLGELRQEGKISASGRGRGARWSRLTQ